MPSKPHQTVAQLIAAFIGSTGVPRVFGLCGGHIQPIWDKLAGHGVDIVDVRDERAAAHMAHAHAELTGQPGVLLVTGGPGVTNAITGIVNAHVARAPLLVISGVPPRPQEGMGALQDLPHTELLRPVTRSARTIRDPFHVLPALREAWAAALGEGGEPGPAYLDFPTDLLREPAPRLDGDAMVPPPARGEIWPDPEAIRRAVDILWAARRPLVISGSGARGAAGALVSLLDALGALYLDSGDSRGLVPSEHSSVVSALRSKVMAEADVVLTVGRQLDFQLAYGSRAIFPNAQFVRVGDSPSTLRDNRRGLGSVLGTPRVVLEHLMAAGAGRSSAADLAWAQSLRAEHLRKSEAYRERMATAPAGSDGYMHPNRLLACLQDALRPDAIGIADGGDILSFARVGLSTTTYLDPGSLGCIGVGVPFGIAAALLFPERQVVVVTGDGAFGFNAMELDTAVRHGAKAVFIVANNGGWNIERYDQQVTYDGHIVGSELRFSDYAALARSLGAHGVRVTDPAELPDALRDAFSNAPALLDVLVTREAVSSDAKSGMAWAPDTQALEGWDLKEKALRGSGEEKN